MKYIKKYENFNKEHNIEVGNYIVINISDSYWPMMSDLKKEFINNNIGQIVKIVGYNSESWYIKYENIPEKLKKYFYNDMFPVNNGKINRSINIIDMSKNEENLNYIFRANKYNL